MKIILFSVTCLFTTLLTTASYAMDDGEEQLYDVELLVFQQLVDSDDGEVWPVDISAWFDDDSDTLRSNSVPEFTDGRTILAPVIDYTTDYTTSHDFGSRPKIEDRIKDYVGNNSAVEPLESQDTLTSEETNPVNEINWLSGDEYRLLDEASALKRSAGFRPLAHIAWRQVVADRNLATPFILPASEKTKTGAYVDGTVKLSLGRYLHLNLNLQLHEILGGDTFELLEFDIPEIRLQEERRMRSKKLHYFDHPRFGVLAIITPYEAPEDEISPELEIPAATAEKNNAL